jgi:two-component system OmpR family sensor kinase
LNNHEKNAFIKFFVTYFLSTAILILASGFFYFTQMKSQFLKVEHFSLIEYARHIKMGESTKKYGSDFSHKFTEKQKYIDIRNFTISDDKFSKYIPSKKSSKYLQVFKSKKSYIKKLQNLKIKIISTQILLLFIFALISFYLAKSALKPLEDSINTLDKFAKDLIHDLNTPVTAMKLNIQILQNSNQFTKTKALDRLIKSIDTISELRENLTILLEEKTFQITNINIYTLVQDIIQLHQTNYPNLKFEVLPSSLIVKANANALKQLLNNLILNACKYNKSDGYIKIYTKDETLYIEDSGIGISEPNKIFDREYSGQNSSGLGLDIVKRLCDAMNISIDVTTNNNGSCFSLKFLSK